MQAILKYGESTINIKGSVKSSVDDKRDSVALWYEPGEGVSVSWPGHEELIPLAVISNIKLYPEEQASK